MRTLTNAFTDIEVVNLDTFSGHRGPFLVTQIGVAPGDDHQREYLFLLRRDGRWADLNHYLGRQQPEAFDEAAFATTQEVMTMLAELGPQAEVADLPVDEVGLATWLAAHPHGTMRENLRVWLASYHERHKDSPPA